MRIELELPAIEECEWDVWGSYEGQEDGDHFATFDTLEAAITYKAEMEEQNPKLRLHVSRCVKVADPSA